MRSARRRVGLLAELGAVEGGPTETSEMVERLGPCSVVVEHTEVEPGRLGRRVPQIHTGREGEPGSGARPQRPPTRRNRQQSVEVVTSANAIAPVDGEPGPVDVHRSRRNLRIDPERIGEALLGVRVEAVNVVAMVAEPSSGMTCSPSTTERSEIDTVRAAMAPVCPISAGCGPCRTWSRRGSDRRRRRSPRHRAC